MRGLAVATMKTGHARTRPASKWQRDGAPSPVARGQGHQVQRISPTTSSATALPLPARAPEFRDSPKTPTACAPSRPCRLRHQPPGPPRLVPLVAPPPKEPRGLPHATVRAPPRGHDLGAPSHPTAGCPDPAAQPRTACRCASSHRGLRSCGIGTPRARSRRHRSAPSRLCVRPDARTPRRRGRWSATSPTPRVGVWAPVTHGLPSLVVPNVGSVATRPAR